MPSSPSTDRDFRRRRQTHEGLPRRGSPSYGWRRRESNPRPRMIQPEPLHAYPAFSLTTASAHGRALSAAILAAFRLPPVRRSGRLSRSMTSRSGTQELPVGRGRTQAARGICWLAVFRCLVFTRSRLPGMQLGIHIPVESKSPPQFQRTTDILRPPRPFRKRIINVAYFQRVGGSSVPVQHGRVTPGSTLDSLVN